MEMINIDTPQPAHHIQLILLFIHTVIVLREREAVSDFQPLVDDKTQQGTLSNLHIAARFFVTMFDDFHRSLQMKPKRIKSKL